MLSNKNPPIVFLINEGNIKVFFMRNELMLMEKIYIFFSLPANIKV